MLLSLHLKHVLFVLSPECVLERPACGRSLSRRRLHLVGGACGTFAHFLGRFRTATLEHWRAILALQAYFVRIGIDIVHVVRSVGGCGRAGAPNNQYGRQEWRATRSHVLEIVGSRDRESDAMQPLLGHLAAGMLMALSIVVQIQEHAHVLD